MARIVILANSKRPDGHCLAGIDLDSGEWVRPVPPSGDGIPTIKCFVDNKLIALRDVLELDLIRPRATAEFQCENQVIRNWNWQITGRLKIAAIEKYIDNAAPILHTSSDRVKPEFLKTLPADKWKSLQLVRPSNLTFGRHYFDANRWVADFEDENGKSYSLKITDPEVTRRLEAGEKPSKNSILTISMTKPWSHNPKERAPLCYKLVAAVID